MSAISLADNQHNMETRITIRLSQELREALDSAGPAHVRGTLESVYLQGVMPDPVDPTGVAEAMADMPKGKPSLVSPLIPDVLRDVLRPILEGVGAEHLRKTLVDTYLKGKDPRNAPPQVNPDGTPWRHADAVSRNNVKWAAKQTVADKGGKSLADNEE